MARLTALGRWAVLGLLLLYLLTPLVATGLFSLATRWDRTLWPEGYTAGAYARILAEPAFWGALGRSLLLAGASVAGAAVLVLPAVLWAELREPRLRPFLEAVALLPYAIPPVLLALGLIQTYAPLPIPFFGTPLLLVCATVAVALPLMYRAVDSAVQAVAVRTLTEAALSLGAGWAEILRRVLLPNLLPGLLGGSLLVFSLSLSEFALANLLVGGSWPTLAVWTYQVMATDGQAASVLTIISFGAAWGLTAAVMALSERYRGGAADVLPGAAGALQELSRDTGRR